MRIHIKALQCKWWRPHLSQNCCWGACMSVWANACLSVCHCPNLNPGLAVAPGVTDHKDWPSAYADYISTQRVACGELPVWGFLCLWAWWRHCWGQATWLGGSSAFVVLSFSCWFCCILSLVSCRLRPLPCRSASLFTSLPLSGLSLCPPQTRVARSQHPVQSHNALAFFRISRQLFFPLCVFGHMLSLVAWFFCVHCDWWMPDYTTLNFPFLECTLIIFLTSLWNCNDVKNAQY